MIELKQSTAGQEIPLGYFLDSSDGDTEEIALTIANTDIKIWKFGATTLSDKNSGGAIHISNGVYYCVLDDIDTNTLGPLVIFIHVSGALATKVVCSVLVPNVWDSKFGTDKLQVDLGTLASGTAAISTTAKNSPDGFVITTGTNETNNEDATHSLDGTIHSLEDNGGVTDAYYIFDVGGAGVPVSVSWWGYANSNGDSYCICVWNWSKSIWEQIGEIEGRPGSTVITAIFDLTNAHVGAGVNIGRVHWRFNSTDGTKFSTDRLLCSYAIVAQSVGYAEGAVWIDTSLSNTNTEPYVDGVADNPVSTLAAATIIANNLGLKRFILSAGSSITLNQAYDGFRFSGAAYLINLNGQSISGCRFYDAIVTGDDSGTNPVVVLFDRCQMLGNSLGLHALLGCSIAGHLTLAEQATYIWDLCLSGIAGTATPSVDFGAANNNSSLNLRHYSGGIEVKNMGAGTGLYNMSLEGFGQLVINSNCSADSVIAIEVISQ